MKKTKCLLIGGSPRKNGNTDLLLKEAFRGAKETGAEGEIIFLRDFNFSPCLGCDGCFKEGQCIVKDDMQIIYNKILEADRLILAAPIFSMGINAQTKAMIDRTQRFWATKYVLKRNVIENQPPVERKGIFISVSGSNFPGVFECSEKVAKYFFKMVEVTYIKGYFYPKTDKKGEILNNQDALKEIFKAGQRLILD